ncbi:hypothetical protein BKA82DRAFT_4168398 [Pisolithus tinctorius]|nr:hypothetical protein BKA82DRAFT_4175318 [Pisolithus tinctorius]KAI6144932.1 hypothetical protein BKA82DRAFT_4168398 [Pisolithus tinctorius]
MLIAGSFYSVSPTTSTRKPAAKRRKLNATSSVPHVEPDTATEKSPTGSGCSSHMTILTCGGNPPFSRSSKLSCSTCHRALPTVRPDGSAMVCSRCLEPTCNICSRTCTSYTRPSSFPPTPALTRSPTPSTSYGISPSNSCFASPRRAALTPGWSAVNCENTATTIPSVKRKKAPNDPDHGDIGITSCHRQSDNPLCEVIDDSTVSVVVPGCGRSICRTCCVESVANDGTLCMDCYALV